MAARDPEARSAFARNAVIASWEKTPDRAARTAKARKAAAARFETEDERRAYFSELGRRSAESRRANALKRKGGE